MSADGACCPPWWVVIILCVLLLLYGFFDVAYFIRMSYTILKARYCKPMICVLEKAHVTSWCFLNDIDSLITHMNNARYLRELDFARADFYERTKLWASIRQAGGTVVQGATTVRYRRYIKPGSTFVITSKAVYWDDKTIFMDHEFISPDGFVNAVATCRQRVIGCGAATVVNLLHQLNCSGKCNSKSPTDIPPEIAAWVLSNDISSAKLRKLTCTCSKENCQCGATVKQVIQEDETEKSNGHVENIKTSHSNDGVQIFVNKSPKAQTKNRRKKK